MGPYSMAAHRLGPRKARRPRREEPNRSALSGELLRRILCHKLGQYLPQVRRHGLYLCPGEPLAAARC